MRGGGKLRVISIEGIDGTGKTTLHNLIRKRLEVNKEVGFVRFPTEDFYSKYEKRGKIKPLTAQEIEEMQSEDKKQTITKLKEHGYKYLFCDRAEVSQIVYNETKETSMESDVVIYLSIELDEALRRIKERKIEDNLGFEQEDTLRELKHRYEEILTSEKYKDKVVEEDVTDQEYTEEFIVNLLGKVLYKIMF